MLAFNGRLSGKPAIFAHVYGTQPAAISYALPFQITHTKGTYGLLLEANLPQVAGEWGNITKVAMTLGRTYRSHGKAHSYLSAACPAPAGFPGATFPLDQDRLSVRRRPHPWHHPEQQLRGQGLMRRHLSFANLASSLALLVALSTSGAFAASQLAPKSVGEPQLRPGAVTAAKIRKNAVTSPKIAAGAILEGKLAAGAVSAAKLADASITTAKLQNSSVITEKLADDSATGEKVAEATLGQVPSAARAGTASFAEAADPAAFAKVSAAGKLDAANSKGIAEVKETEAGIYCVSVSSFNPTGAQITPQFNGIGTTDAFARIGGAASCPSPQIEVQDLERGSEDGSPLFSSGLPLTGSRCLEGERKSPAADDRAG